MNTSIKLVITATWAVALSGLLPGSPVSRAQAGGGGAAGAGSAAGASGPGAGAAAGRGAAPPGSAQQAPSGNNNGGQAGPGYAAGINLGLDPRKPPTSRPGALTLAQVLDHARSRNPTLLAAEQNLRAVRAQELQARVRTNPYLTLYGTDVTEGVNAVTPYNYSLQISRLFERGEKRRWRIDTAQATTAETEAQLNDTVRQTTLTIKTAFTHMLIAKQALQLASASLKDFRHEVEIANDRYKAGDLGKLDYERLDLQLGNLESDEANDIVTLQQSSDQLQTLMGIEMPSHDFDIAGDTIPPAVIQPLQALVQSALEHRPDYTAAKFAVAAADANARLAIANGTTDPTLEAEYDRSGPENTAGFSINIPLRLFDKNEGNKQTARLQADASRNLETAVHNQVILDVDQAWIAYTQAKQLSDRFSTHYLDESADVLNIAQFAFEHGGIALIDYLDALRDARSSTSNALNAYQQTWIAIHQLAAASSVEVVP